MDRLTGKSKTFRRRRRRSSCRNGAVEPTPGPDTRSFFSSLSLCILTHTSNYSFLRSIKLRILNSLVLFASTMTNHCTHTHPRHVSRNHPFISCVKNGKNDLRCYDVEENVVRRNRTRKTTKKLFFAAWMRVQRVWTVRRVF